MEAILGLPFDILVVVLIVALLVAYNYTIGKNRSATLLVALYVSGALYMLLPLTDFAHEVFPVDNRLLPLIMFGVLLVVVHVILSRNAFFEPYLVPSGWELGVFSVLHAVLLIAIVVSIESSATTAEFSPNFSRIFLDPLARSAIIMGPLVFLAFFRGRA